MYKRLCRERLGTSRSSRSNENKPKMKLIVLAVVALVACAVAAPAAPAAEPIKIIRSEFDQRPEGGYSYAFESEDGTSRQENGELKEALDEENKPHSVVVVRGQYSYTDSEGKPQTITYFADETGFHAEGDTIPKPVRR